MSPALIFPICGPSGAGKSTIIRTLLAREPRPFFSLAATTRAPRKGEVAGRDYLFVDRTRFEELRAAGALLEAAVRFGHWYGELRAPLETALARGVDVLVDTDPGGARQIAEAYPGLTTSIGLVPPSLKALQARLRARGASSSEDLEARLSTAAAAVLALRELDHLILTDDLEASVKHFALIREIAHRAARQALAIENVMSEAVAATRTSERS